MFGLILTKVNKVHKIEVKSHMDIRCMQIGGNFKVIDHLFYQRMAEFNLYTFH